MHLHLNYESTLIMLQKLKLSVGVPTGDVLIVAHLEGKHTDTIFNMVRQIAYIHGRGPFY
jgi:hypothetical protein